MHSKNRCYRRQYRPSASVAASLLCLVCAPPVYAATDAGQLLRQEQDLEKLRQTPGTLPELPASARPPLEQGDAPRLRVQAFRMTGSLAEGSGLELDRLLADYIGRELTFEDIRHAANLVSEHFRRRGHFLARVTVPKQEVTEGVVELHISEGRLDAARPVRVQGNHLRLRQERLEGTIARAMNGGVLITGLERGILNINDNPGVASTAILEPGDDPGSTRVVLEASEGPVISGLVVADNFGSRLTGRHRLAAVANLNDPFGYGDQLSVSAITAPGKDFGYGRLAYSFPVGLSGLRGGIAYSALRYHAESGASLPSARGTARDLNLNLRYPLYRSGLAGLYLGLNYDRKSSYSEELDIATGDKRDQVLAASITAERTDTLLGGGFTQLQWTLFAGHLDLSRQPMRFAADQGAFGPQADGSFRKSNIALARVQHGSDRLSFQFLASGQTASKNLDSMEKFAIGGPTGVRAYPSEEGFGDEGYKVSLEGRYTLASRSKVGDVLVTLFYDRGRIRQYKHPGLVNLTTPNAYSLAGWGVSLDLVSAAKYSMKLAWAHALGGNPAASASGNNADGRADRSRLWLLANFNF